MPTSTITAQVPRPPAGRATDAAVGGSVQPPCSSDRPGLAPQASKVLLRPRRGRRLGVSAVAITALLVPLGAACGSSDASTTSTSTHAHAVDASAPSPTDDPHTLAVTLADFSFATDKSEVASGPATFQVTNEGREAHQLMVGRLKPGATADSFLSTYRDQGEPAAFGLVEWAGGVNGIAPGASADGTSDLEPGDYLMVCFLRGADGVSHVMKQMVGSFRVVHKGVEPAAPEASDTLTVRDYAIDVPAGFTGNGVVQIRNEGKEPHEVALLRLDDGKALPDAFAWYADPTGPPPFTEAGGIGVVEPGTPAWSTMHLRPGNYVAVCFVPGPGGSPHALLGMVTPFTVS